MLARSLFVAIVCLLTAVPASAKEYYASRFDVRIDVLQGGTLRVTETLIFHFTEGTFREVFRTVPTRRTDGIEFVSASMDGQTFPEGQGPGSVRVRRNDEVRVDWRFPPVGPGVHTFGITYLVRGVVRQTADADLLEWRALPREHDYRIDASTVEVRVPQTPVRPPSLDTRRVDGRAEVQVGDGVVVAEADQIRRNGSFVVSIALPPQSVLDTVPAWQARQMRQQERAPLWASAAALVLLAGCVLLFALGQNYEKAPAELGVRWESMIPPESLPPALAGALVSNGSPHLEHAMATLFSLAERGLLVIREGPRGRFGQRHFVLERAARTAHLTPHEEAALAGAFGASEAASVPLSKARSHFTRPSRWREFKSAVMRELAEADLLDPRRQASRRRFTKVGVAFLILAVLAIAPSLFLAREHGGWPFLVPAAFGLVALVSFIIMGAQTPLSNNGVRRAEQWRAFKKHIAQPQDIEPRWGAAGSAEARILPVAIALGLASAWSKYLRKRNAHTPAWFHAASGLDSGHAFATFVAYGGAGAHGGSSAGAGAGGAAGGGASGAS